MLLIDTFREAFQAGFVTSLDAHSTLDMMNEKIHLSSSEDDKEYLTRLQERSKSLYPFGKAVKAVWKTYTNLIDTHKERALQKIVSRKWIWFEPNSLDKGLSWVSTRTFTVIELLSPIQR